MELEGRQLHRQGSFVSLSSSSSSISLLRILEANPSLDADLSVGLMESGHEWIRNLYLVSFVGLVLPPFFFELDYSPSRPAPLPFGPS